MESVAATSKLFCFLLFVSLVLNCFTDFRSDAQKLLPLQEVQALQNISAKLQIKHLNFNQSFCSSGRFVNVTETGTAPTIITNITCNCSSTVCHVTSIILKGLDLTGILPEELANLKDLQQIDLSRNYISGSIPKTFAQLPALTNLSLGGNRISGSIPEEIGDITTLEQLVLDQNQLGGALPERLGYLTNLKRLVLSANNFTGKIPDTFSKLKNLTEFRIDGNGISGKIPDLIGNWTKIVRLDMQGTSMDGPIPYSIISQMKSIKELRISDLNGSSSKIPDLQGLEILKVLVLRNCQITDQIPYYIGELPKLKTFWISPLGQTL